MLKSCTLSDFSRNWLEYLRPRIKESSFTKYHNLLENYIIPELGELPAEELTYADIDNFCTDLLAEGGAQNCGLSPKTVQDTLSDYISSNPDDFTLGILISLFMGLRIGEVCALKWEDISLYDQTIHIRRTMQRIQVEGAKTHKTSVRTPPWNRRAKTWSCSQTLL